MSETEITNTPEIEAPNIGDLLELIRPHLETFEGWQDAWSEVCKRTQDAQRRSLCARYVQGYVLNYGEERYNQEVSQFLNEQGLQASTLKKIRWVAGKVPPGIAEEFSTLEFGHLDAVAGLEHDRQRECLTKARDEDWGVRELRKHVSGKDGDAHIHASESNEWGTPTGYIERVNLVFPVELDPASSEFFNETVGAPEFFGIGDNGLEQKWKGKVFLNPPYGKTEGKSTAGKWVEKLVDEYENGDVTEAIALVNANTGDKWFQVLFDYLLCFCNHRIAFYNEQGPSKNPGHSNCFVYLGENRSGFIEVFSDLGPIVERVEL